MKSEEILKLLETRGAVLQGHFLLSSGLHSNCYIQCARLFQDPQVSEKIAKELAKPFTGKKIDWVVGPAIGGILPAYELARQLKAEVAFTERQDGVMALRRGFSLRPESRVLLAEDVITTGGSTREVAGALEPYRPEIIGVAAVVNRSGIQFPYPIHSLLTLELDTEAPAKCRLCQGGIPLVKPGSR